MSNTLIPKTKDILYRFQQFSLIRNSSLIKNAFRYRRITSHSKIYFPSMRLHGIRSRYLYSTSVKYNEEDPFSSIRDDHGDEDKYISSKRKKQVFEEEDEEEDDFDQNKKENSLFYVDYERIEQYRKKLLEVDDSDEYIVKMKSLIEQEKYDEVIDLFNELKSKNMENYKHFSIASYARLILKRFFESISDFKSYAKNKAVTIEILNVMIIASFSLFRRKKAFNTFIYANTLPTIGPRTYDIVFSFYALERNYEEIIKTWRFYKKYDFFEKEDLDKKIYLNYLPALISEGFYRDIMRVLRRINSRIDLDILSMFEGNLSNFDHKQQNDIINFIISKNGSLKNTKTYFNIKFEMCQNIGEVNKVIDEYKLNGFEFDIKTYLCLFLNTNIDINDLNSLYTIDDASIEDKKMLLSSITAIPLLKNIDKVKFMSKQFEPYNKHTLYHLIYYYTSIDDAESLQSIVEYIFKYNEPIYKRSYSSLLKYYINRSDLDAAFSIWSHAITQHRRIYINDCIALMKNYTKNDSIDQYSRILDYILESNSPHRWTHPLNSLILELDEKGEFILLVQTYKILKKHNLYMGEPKAFKRLIYATFQISNTSDIIDIVEETVETIKNPVTVNIVVERFLKYLSMKTDKYNDYVNIILKLIEERKGLDKLSTTRLKYLFMMVRNDKDI